jgi:hypothetical protein
MSALQLRLLLQAGPPRSAHSHADGSGGGKGLALQHSLQT